MQTSVALAAGSGGNEFGQREMTGLYSKGPKSVGAYQSIAWFYAASTGQSSIRHGTKGPASVLVTEGAGGLDSLGHARRVVRRGTTRRPRRRHRSAAVPLRPDLLRHQRPADRRGEPAGRVQAVRHRRRRVRPGRGRGGAARRGSRRRPGTRSAPQIYAEIAGYAATHDAYRPQRSGARPRQFARAMQLALDDAGVAARRGRPGVADGAGVAELDALEAAALRTVLGDGRRRTGDDPVRASSGGSTPAVPPWGWPPPCSPCATGVIPPVGNLDEPDPGVRARSGAGATRATVNVVLINARGYGGFNSSMVLRQVARAGHSNDGPGRSSTVKRSIGDRTILRMRAREGCEEEFEAAWRRAAAEISRVPGNVRQELARDVVRPPHIHHHQRLDRPGRRRRVRPQSSARDAITAALRDLREDAARSTYELLYTVPAEQAAARSGSI